MTMLSVMGLYNYDNTIFDGMVLPRQINKEDLVVNLLMDTAEREVIYSDPDFLKFAITNWSKKQLPVWTRLANAFDEEFSAIENVFEDTVVTTNKDGWNKDRGTKTFNNQDNRTETYNNIKDTTNYKGSEKETENGGTYKETEERVLTNETIKNEPDFYTDSSKSNRKGKYDSGNGNIQNDVLTTTKNVAGFNSSTLQPAESTTEAGSTFESGKVHEHGTKEDQTHNIESDKLTKTHEGSRNTERTFTNRADENIKTGNLTDNTSHTGNIDDDNDHEYSDTEVVTTKRHGNIGVTKSTELLSDYFDVIPSINVMDFIIKDFKQRFCLGVY